MVQAGQRANSGLSGYGATLAHINARYMAFASGPEMQNRARLAELKEKERRSRIVFGPPLTCREQAPLLRVDALPAEEGGLQSRVSCRLFGVLDRGCR